MPIFNWNAFHQDDPQAHIAKFGLQVAVQIGFHPVVTKAMTDAGVVVPAPAVGNGIIDTGATITAIDLKCAKELGLAPMGTRMVGTASGPKEYPTFAFSVQIATNLRFDCVPGMGCELSGQGIIALIGMDLISRCVLNVNAPGGMVTLAM